MKYKQPIGKLAVCLLAACVAIWAGTAAAQESKTSEGLTVYLGVVRAEIIKGPATNGPERTMHGGTPHGAHEYHVTVAVFDAARNARVQDASVTARVSGLGLSGSSTKLEPMQIAGTTTYGAFVNLPGRDLYTVKLSIDRPGGAQPVTMTFKYDHRR